MIEAPRVLRVARSGALLNKPNFLVVTLVY